MPQGWKLSPDDLLIDFFTVMPGWVDALFKLRNVIVKPFGLKGGERGGPEIFRRVVREGGSAGLVSVEGKTGNETLIRLSDSHLDAWLSVMYDEGWIYAITVVKYHRWLGRAYFFFIKPFHRIIVPAMLKSSLKRLSSQSL